MKVDALQMLPEAGLGTPALRIVLPFYCGLASMALGAAVFLGWIFDVATLKRLATGPASMKANSALAFIAAGLALARLARPPAQLGGDRIAVGAAFFVLLVSVATLAEYALGANLGIDQLVIRDDEPGLAPGRMSPITAAAFFAAAAALLVPQTPSQGFNVRCLLWATILVVAAAALLGHAIDVSQLYRIGAYAGIAVHTAAGFAILALGGLTQSWPSGRFAALLARTAVPNGPSRYILAAVVVLLAGWLRYVLGEVAGLNLPYITFYLTVMAIAVFAGPWPGVFATLFSALIVNLYFLAPVGQPSLTAADLIGMTIFIISGLVVSLLASVLHRLYREAAGARDYLEQQVSERTAALRQSERSAAHLAAIVTSASDAILSKTLDGVITSWNAAAERMFGYTAGEMVGQSVRRLIPPDRQDEEDRIRARLRAGERIDHYETVRLARDGRRLDVSLAISPIRDSSGSIIGASKIAHDIGERKRAERHRQMLVNELNHRVKNTLATVQSIAAQTLRTSPDVGTARERFEARLMALSKAHDVLTRENWESAPLADIVERAIAPYCGAARERFLIDGPALRVTPRHALAIAMALHELCTNAVKYGALSNDKGKVTITWSVSANSENARKFTMCWSETGGPLVVPPERRGFGSRLIERGLASDLGGEVTIDFAKTGVICTIVAPLVVAAGQVPNLAEARSSA